MPPNASICLPHHQVLSLDNAGSEGNAPVLLLLTLQKISATDAALCTAVRAALFPPDWLSFEFTKERDPYRPPCMEPNWDPNTPLPIGAPVHLRLVQRLTCTNHTLKTVVGDLLYTLSGEDAGELVRLVGLGSAAGWLSERGMFSAFQQTARAS